MSQKMIRRIVLLTGALTLAALVPALGAHAQIPGADFEIVKTADPQAPNVGDNLTYTLTVTNNGPDASVATVIDTLPPTATFVSVDPSADCQGQPNNPVVNCNVPNLAEGETDVITIVVQPQAPGPILNVASVVPNTLDPQPQNNVSDVLTIVGGTNPVPHADISVKKKADPDPGIVGEDLHYTITVKNHGPDPATSHVVDTLPLNVDFKSITPSRSEDACPNGQPGSPIVECDLGVLSSGDEATFDLVVTPTQPIPALNTVAVVSDDTLDLAPQNNAYLLLTLINAATPTPTPTDTTPAPTNPSPTSTTPIGGIQTGGGGTAGGFPWGPVLGGGLLLFGLALWAIRRGFIRT